MATPDFTGLLNGPASIMTLTTTLTNISGLSINLLSGGKYRINAWITFSTTGTTTTISAALGFTGTVLMPSGYSMTIRNNSTTDSANLQQSVAFPGIANPSGVLANAANYGIVIDGFISVGNAGALNLMAKVGAVAATIPINAATLMVEQVG